MQGSTTDRTSTGYVAIHPLDPEDAAITTAMRAMVSSSKGARPGIEARGQFDALMESVLPRGDVTFEADTLGGIPGLWVHPADWRSGEAITSTCTVVGLTLAPPKHTAILPGILQRERERGRLSRTIGLLPIIHFRQPRATCWHVTKDLPRGTFTGLLLPETPLEAIWHSDLRRALPAKPPPSTRLLSELPCCRRLPT